VPADIILSPRTPAGLEARTMSMRTHSLRAARPILLAVALGAAAAAVSGLAACNTVEGAAQDVKNLGKSAADTTERVFSDDPKKD
jgi:predicted small secreted protein